MAGWLAGGRLVAGWWLVDFKKKFSIYIWFHADCTIICKSCVTNMKYMFIIQLVTLVLLFFLPSASVPKILLIPIGLLLIVGVDVGVNFDRLFHFTPSCTASSRRVESVLVEVVVCSLD